MQIKWQQDLAEAEEHALQLQNTEEAPTEPATSRPRTLNEAVAQALPVQGQPLAQPAQPLPQRAQPLHRTQQWLQRNPQEAELRYMSAHQEHQRATQEWEAQMHASQQAQPPPLPPNPRPTTMYTELQVRAALDVQQALRDNDPVAQRPGSATEAPLKRPPPSAERPMLKAFYGGSVPPIIDSATQPTPPPRPVPSATCPSSTPTTGPPAQPAQLGEQTWKAYAQATTSADSARP